MMVTYHIVIMMVFANLTFYLHLPSFGFLKIHVLFTRFTVGLDERLKLPNDVESEMNLFNESQFPHTSPTEYKNPHTKNCPLSAENFPDHNLFYSKPTPIHTTQYAFLFVTY